MTCWDLINNYLQEELQLFNTTVLLLRQSALNILLIPKMIYSLRKQAECDKLETRQTNQGKTDPNNVNNVNNKAKRAHQHMGGPEEVAEGVVEEVDEGGSVEVGVAHHLRGEERLS